MSYGMYIAAEGAKVQSQRLQVISNNLANVDTVGFKPDVPIFQARYSEAIQTGDAYPGSRELTDLGGGVKTIETLTDFSPGRLEPTGNRGDVAILGEGFFAVDAGDGSDQPLLTRAGVFRLDNQSRLVTADKGLPVLSTEFAPITLDPTNPEYEIGSDGSVTQGGEVLGQIALVQPESLDSLEKTGGNLFRSREDVFPVAAEAREVRQRFRELSSVESTSQLMSMIETQRAFQANTEMIRHQDTATGGLISRVLG